MTYTQTGTTGVRYEDGVEVGRNANVTIKPGAIGAGVTTANYLGRSLCTGDTIPKASSFRRARRRSARLLSDVRPVDAAPSLLKVTR